MAGHSVTGLRDELQASLGDAYTLESELGGGGMSRVFIAAESALGRRVVVKVLAPEMSGSVSIERFKREIAFAARLQHPHIVPLLNAGEAGGIPYFTMPFVEGQSLRARLTRDGELPINEGVRILREIASALSYAHEQGVVHRDIKPDNVLLSRGSAMVTDFGVAKALSASSNGDQGGMTSLGVALGTPAYMAPEQAAASPNIDARADVYAWGIVAYEMFAGRAPFSGRSPQAMLAAQVTEAPEAISKLRPNPAAGPGIADHAIAGEALRRPTADGGRAGERPRRDHDTEWRFTTDACGFPIDERRSDDRRCCVATTDHRPRGRHREVGESLHVTSSRGRCGGRGIGSASPRSWSVLPTDPCCGRKATTGR